MFYWHFVIICLVFVVFKICRSYPLSISNFGYIVLKFSSCCQCKNNVLSASYSYYILIQVKKLAIEAVLLPILIMMFLRTLLENRTKIKKNLASIGINETHPEDIKLICQYSFIQL